MCDRLRSSHVLVQCTHAIEPLIMSLGRAHVIYVIVSNPCFNVIGPSPCHWAEPMLSMLLGLTHVLLLLGRAHVIGPSPCYLCYWA
ncbi:hypothetical protein HanHA300_Chr12g0455191 [Helianthus annuus]|nr:hypothetical protein HanHA300_Chr12g0455191 [Helianthus annuus]KAJ0506332.1 hypothetical protein HanHA89_Chr12g0480771 [Helianthus annuus]KAJ0676006.1 hypothetical protein HanLR1_Chr12g0457711 [Helianthus annuus]